MDDADRIKAELAEIPGAEFYEKHTIGDYSMNSAMDQQLMRNVEMYVLQNMSRGQINLEEMSSAMGMGRVPFFHRIRAITQKTPAELVRDLRLRHACTLLERTDINLSELAINVGFITAETSSTYSRNDSEYRHSNTDWRTATDKFGILDY